jgi:WD40 repeat protein
VAASHGRDIDAWPLDGDAPPATLPGTKRSRSVRGMTFTPDGQLLAAGSDGLARLWDPAGGLVREWDFGLRNVQSVAVAPDGLTAAVGGHDGRITVWDL